MIRITRDDTFNNAKLSPFAGRIRDGQYVFNDTKYNLFMNYPEEGNACHGFIYDKKFLLTGKIINEQKASCILLYDYEGEHEGYPFNYSIEINYTLTSSNGLKCTTKIINHSDNSIPLSDGWHHYYDLGVKVDDLKLKLDVSTIVELDERNIPTKKRESFTEFNAPSRIADKYLTLVLKSRALTVKRKPNLFLLNMIFI